jgi:hypothetical protein
VKFYIWQNALALDQLFNTLTGGFADETLSSRAYRAELNGARWGWCVRRLIDGLFFFDPNHCAVAFRSEMDRLHLPSEFRTPYSAPQNLL